MHLNILLFVLIIFFPIIHGIISGKYRFQDEIREVVGTDYDNDYCFQLKQNIQIEKSKKSAIKFGILNLIFVSVSEIFTIFCSIFYQTNILYCGTKGKWIFVVIFLMWSCILWCYSKSEDYGRIGTGIIYFKDNESQKNIKDIFLLQFGAIILSFLLAIIYFGI